MRLHNTLSRSLQDLTPLDPKTVKLYTCGLTVYSQPHIGNWVSYIYWDILVRTLKQAGYNVQRTQNITDVGHLVSDDDEGEDKMEKGAKLEGLSAWEIATKYIAIADHEAYSLLGLLRPDKLVRATDYIPQQIAFAKSLDEKGFLYKIGNEGMYFDTSKLKDYGKLAHLDIKGLRAGARVPVEGKRALTDFAVWKFSPSGQTRDMEWESPWGTGFPGWHLECSVIARETLGDQIDIHTGGVDHIPVHHTNEIAQSEAVTGKQFAQIWVHNNHLKVDGGKMSKSLGNIYTLQDITERGYNIMAFKLMVLGKHYSTEGNFTWSILGAAQSRLKNYLSLTSRRFQPVKDGFSDNKALKGFKDSIATSLNEDLNTSKALSYLDRFETATIQGIQSDLMPEFIKILQFVDDSLGLGLLQNKDIDKTQKKLLLVRQKARDEKDFELSDTLRSKLLETGLEVRDTANGEIWNRI